MQWMNSSLHLPSSLLDPAGLQTNHWTSHLLGGGGEGEKGHALWPRLGNIPALKWGGIESMLEIFTRTTGHNKEATCQNVKGTGPTKTRAVHCASSGRILAFSKSITCGPAWMLGNEGSGAAELSRVTSDHSDGWLPMPAFLRGQLYYSGHKMSH